MRSLIRSFQGIGRFLNRKHRQSIERKQQLLVLLKQLRQRERTIRQEMLTNRSANHHGEHQSLQIDAEITNRQRRKGVKLLKTLIQEIRAKA